MRAALTIAGSDSGGGAGIQADLKTFSAWGVYGASALTAVTAQNTRGVRGFVALEPSFVAEQIDAVLSDLRIDAVKTGMVANADIAATIADRLRYHRARHVVVDPVMVAASGDPLLDAAAETTIAEHLIPLAEVVTPNLPEAEVLTGMTVRTVEDMREAAVRILRYGCGAVLIKGGHLEGDPVDLLIDEKGAYELSSERIPTIHTHGTGCTYAAAIAARLAEGRGLREAVQEAHDYLAAAIRSAFPVGQGRGPVHHFHHWFPPSKEGPA